MLGMHGTYRANMAISTCDLLIAVGVRFDDRVTGKTDMFRLPGQNRAHRYRSDLHPQEHTGFRSGGRRLQKSLSALTHPGRREDLSAYEGRKEWLEQVDALA
jgi:thiamine pyrophosphate-dependent acetolactate synthase large subunit-like protein